MDYKTSLEIEELVYDQGYSESEAFKKVLGHVPDRYLPNYSIAPTNQVPIIKDQLVDVASWGFKRPWTKAPLINATVEKLTEARTWKKPMRERRCLIPLSGYYEWEPSTKTPHYITNGEPLWACGMWDLWEDSQHFTMITTVGTDKAGQVHDRMPLFLSKNLWQDWIQSKPLTEPEVADLLATVQEETTVISQTLNTWEVSRNINNVRTADKKDETLTAKV